MNLAGKNSWQQASKFFTGLRGGEAPTFIPHSKYKQRFAIVLSTILLSGMGTISFYSSLQSRQQYDQQIINKILPLTSDVVSINIGNLISQTVLASRLTADNSLLVDLLLSGNQNEKAISTYLASIKRNTGANTTFLVSENTHKYYNPTGLVRTIRPTSAKDKWYKQFVNSAKESEINIDRDTAEPSQYLALVNVRIEGADRKLLGVAGLALEVDFLNKKLTHYQREYDARLLVIDKNGEVILSSDGSNGSLSELPDIGQYSKEILSQSSKALQLDCEGSDIYLNTIQIPGSDWTLAVIQKPSNEEKALRLMLIQNGIAALVIGLLLIGVGRLTIGRDQRKLEHSANTDPLTSLLNRQSFAETFERLTNVETQSRDKLAVAIMDIDHFKAINDTYGHQAGDTVIRNITASIKSSMRGSDPIFRWGGEEFLVLLPGANQNQAEARLESLRIQLNNSKVQLETTDDYPTVTLSIGLTIYKPGETSATVLNRADQALYAAKTNGRNQICVMSEDDRAKMQV